MKSTFITLHVFDDHVRIHWSQYGQHKLACFKPQDTSWPSLLSQKRYRLPSTKVILICHNPLIMHQRIACEQTIPQQQLQHFARCQLQANFAQPADSLYFDIKTLDGDQTNNQQILWLVACQRKILASLMASIKTAKLRLNAIWIAEQLMLEIAISAIRHNDAIVIIINRQCLLQAYVMGKRIIDIAIQHQPSLLVNNIDQWTDSSTLPRYVVSESDNDDATCRHLIKQHEPSYWLQLQPRFRWHYHV